MRAGIHMYAISRVPKLCRLLISLMARDVFIIARLPCLLLAIRSPYEMLSLVAAAIFQHIIN